MKILFVLLVLSMAPISALAESLYCTADLTNAQTPLRVLELREEVRDFRVEARFTKVIEGSDFSFTVTTGLTKDIMDDPEEPTYIGKPTLISLVVYNSSKNNVSRVDVPMMDVAHTLNLTVGSAEAATAFRIHVVCTLK